MDDTYAFRVGDWLDGGWLAECIICGQLWQVHERYEFDTAAEFKSACVEQKDTLLSIMRTCEPLELVPNGIEHTPTPSLSDAEVKRRKAFCRITAAVFLHCTLRHPVATEALIDWLAGPVPSWGLATLQTLEHLVPSGWDDDSLELDCDDPRLVAAFRKALLRGGKLTAAASAFIRSSAFVSLYPDILVAFRDQKGAVQRSLAVDVILAIPDEAAREFVATCLLSRKIKPEELKDLFSPVVERLHDEEARSPDPWMESLLRKLLTKYSRETGVRALDYVYAFSGVLPHVADPTDLPFLESAIDARDPDVPLARLLIGGLNAVECRDQLLAKYSPNQYSKALDARAKAALESARQELLKVAAGDNPIRGDLLGEQVASVLLRRGARSDKELVLQNLEVFSRDGLIEITRFVEGVTLTSAATVMISSGLTNKTFDELLEGTEKADSNSLHKQLTSLLEADSRYVEDYPDGCSFPAIRPNYDKMIRYCCRGTAGVVVPDEIVQPRFEPAEYVFTESCVPVLIRIDGKEYAFKCDYNRGAFDIAAVIKTLHRILKDMKRKERFVSHYADEWRAHVFGLPKAVNAFYEYAVFLDDDHIEDILIPRIRAAIDAG